MSAQASKELLKAHAVISRSWLLAQIEKNFRLEGKEEKQAAGTGDGEKAGAGEEKQAGAGEEKTGQGGEDPLNGAGDERLAELNGKKVAELREIAKGMGIQGYANMNKDTLVAMIMNH